MALDDFIRAQIRTAKREPSPATPDVSECLDVVRVAKTSIASFAGVVPGDLLVSVSGRPASKVGTSLRSSADERRYQFYSPKSGDRLRLETTGVELGITLRPHPAAIAAMFETSRDPAQLEVLWEAGKWSMLEKLARKNVGKKIGLFGRLFGKKQQRNTPALVLLGAALFELGKTAEGIALIREYEQKYSRYWTMQWMAIARYYAGRERVLAKRNNEAADALTKAFELNPYPRIADTIQKLGGRRPEKPSGFLGRRLPLDYDLPTHDDQKRVSLAASAAALGPGQLLAIFALGAYRGNGPYNELMLRWGGYGVHFKEQLAGLHIITETKPREVERPDWYKGEDLVRLKGLSMTLLWDRGGEVGRAVQPAGSPWVYLIDRARTVHHDGELDDVDIWDAVAGAERAAAETP